MKAFDILCELLYATSAAAHSLESLERSVRSLREIASDTAEGVIAPPGLAQDAARDLADFLSVDHAELETVRRSVRRAKAHASTLLQSLQAGDLVDRLDDGCGGEVVIVVTT